VHPFDGEKYKLIIVVSYTPEEKKLFESDASALHQHRRDVEEAMNEYMTESGFTYGTPRQQAIAAKFKEHMTDMLKEKPQILDTLLPVYPPGCRRRKFSRKQNYRHEE
jgi:hypothetical protein